MDRLAEHREAIAHERMCCNVVERRKRPYVHDIALQADLSAMRQTADVNHRTRLTDTDPHPVQELGATRQDRDSGARRSVDGRDCRSGPGVHKRFHGSASAAARTAATICGYAEQRQRFPLIHSRISAGSFAWPSLMHPTADMI
jgi:hypothetical protein